jgi:hypothetical protein
MFLQFAKQYVPEPFYAATIQKLLKEMSSKE